MYTLGVAYSESGNLGWTMDTEKDPITPPNLGHVDIVSDLGR